MSPRTASADPSELRVLVVDDSAVNRRSISNMLSGAPHMTVVGKAANGEEALRMVRVCEPDVITLDLEMPKMDGFTFLRIVMAKTPLPVIVVSSYSQHENVFKALELGALDFVAKPDLLRPGDDSIQSELLSKLAIVRGELLLQRPRRRQPVSFSSLTRASRGARPPSKLVVIAASTGGPSALLEVLAQLPATTDLAILVAQHMPEKFTRTFAERLHRGSNLVVREAEHDELIRGGEVLVCPGMRCLEVARVGDRLRTRVMPPAASDRFFPSADRLFASAAKACPNRCIGVVLTGMADDGTKGSVALAQAGGYIMSESEETAVVYGMPRAVQEAGVVHEQLPLYEIPQALLKLEHVSLSQWARVRRGDRSKLGMD